MKIFFEKTVIFLVILVVGLSSNFSCSASKPSTEQANVSEPSQIESKNDTAVNSAKEPNDKTTEKVEGNGEIEKAVVTESNAKKVFDLRNASQYFDIKIAAADCDKDACKGKASFSFFKKGGNSPYQVINLDDTYIELDGKGEPNVNETLLYDKQSVVNIGDFNFDGMEDVALCNGTNGSYGMPSYNVYLSSKAVRKFVFDKEFSSLGTHLGMFEVDKSKKVLRTLDKSGCCFHVTEEFSVINNRPVKVFSEEEDATIEDESKVKITTKKFINGKWQTSIKYEARKE